ncbi:MAG: hypothetical protein ACRD0D_12390, partial [Acidimicrobiales bacterium]
LAGGTRQWLVATGLAAPAPPSAPFVLGLDSHRTGNHICAPSATPAAGKREAAMGAPNITMTVEPIESGAVVYAPLAPPRAGSPAQGQLEFDAISPPGC